MRGFKMEAVLEGLLFVVGDDGLSLEQIKDVLEIDFEEIKALIKSLQEEYSKDTRGIKIEFLGNKLKLTTKSEHHLYYQKLLENKETHSLSQAALETLAIVAYNQPLTRIQVDQLRGIASAPMIRKLVAKGFIKESGRSNLPGRPILYETTSDFLDYFGLANINDLPDMRDFLSTGEAKDEQVDLYESKYKEID